MLYFFRDPHRKPEEGFIEGKSIVAPADGDVCAIEEDSICEL